MDPLDSDFSTQKIKPQLLEKIIEVLKDTPYGSVEIYIENHVVTHINKKQVMKLTRVKPKRKFTISVTRNFSQRRAE